MNKTIRLILAASAIALAGCSTKRQAAQVPTIAFLHYETGSDGIVRAWFTASNTEGSFVVCKAQPEPGIAAADWSASMLSVPSHGTATFGLPVTQTGKSWRLGLTCWRFEAKPHDVSHQQLSRKPDFKVESSVIRAGAPVKQGDA